MHPRLSKPRRTVGLSFPLVSFRCFSWFAAASVCAVREMCAVRHDPATKRRGKEGAREKRKERREHAHEFNKGAGSDPRLSGGNDHSSCHLLVFAAAVRSFVCVLLCCLFAGRMKKVC